MGVITDWYNDIVDSTAVTINGTEVKRCKPPKTVVSRYIAPIYNDWRQYYTNYYLYLPFVGIVALESERYVGHTLTVRLFVDVRTANIKFYILSDDVLMEQYESSCRVSLPCSSASPYSATRSKVASAEQLLTNTVGVASGVATGNTGAVVGSIRSGVSNAYGVIQPIPKKSVGSFSPSTAIYDSLHIYIMTETPEIIVDEGLKNNYGMPCNIWSSIGSHSGYIEVDDIRLKGAIPPDDKAEILNALKSGIYVV